MTFGASSSGAAAGVPADKARLRPANDLAAGKPDDLSENEIQKAVFSHLRTRGVPGIFAFHPKNASADMAGRKRGIHVGLGVEPGVPDVFVIKFRGEAFDYSHRICEVFALELKRFSRRGKASTKHEAKQEETRQRMWKCGVTVGVAYGLDHALMWLEQHGLLRGSRS